MRREGRECSGIDMSNRKEVEDRYVHALLSWTLWDLEHLLHCPGVSVRSHEKENATKWVSLDGEHC